MTGEARPRGTIRAAVVGAGHLGKFHARVYSEIPDVDLRYVVDIDRARARQVAGEYGAEARADYKGILGEVDIASIATPTTTHHEIARAFLEAGVSVLVEKPMTTTVEQADDLIRLAEARPGVKLQVGHIERFNPAYRAIRDYVREPAFIECHRLSPYSFRSTDVSVVLDLMIHDLDLILDIAGTAPASVEAAGVTILSPSTDIANARLRFDRPDGAPGCIANVTASRVSPKPMRRLRVFQSDAYISMDFLEKTVHVFRKKEEGDLGGPAAEQMAAVAKMPAGAALGQLLDIRQMDIAQTDALMDEISAFVRAVRDDTAPPVTGEHGRRALALAVAIDENIQQFLADRKE